MLADRVYEVSDSLGDGVFVLTAVSKYRRFSAAFAQGDVLAYAIVHRTEDEWEVGYGYLNGSGELVRETVLNSSTGSKVSFTDGLKDVINTAPAVTLQNYVGTVEPTNPFSGQFWYTGTQLRIYSGTQFHNI